MPVVRHSCGVITCSIYCYHGKGEAVINNQPHDDHADHVPVK